MGEMVDMPRKEVPPPLELVKSRIDEALPPEVRSSVESGAVALVDTRDPDRFQRGRIPGAVNVPAGANGVDSHTPDFAARISEAAGGKPALLYCGTGSRSARAADALTNEHGVARTRSLIGGITLWSDLGFPVEGSIEPEHDSEEATD
ncbi:MAG TPA: rhodanese-like domain-containing protein [Solirubrobacterales bacterium]|jgi:rhodanese-related sulfurtransferase|nr:rhodanese-like domain-containing protein [Solirubrobacterales bacterium]